MELKSDYSSSLLSDDRDLSLSEIERRSKSTGWIFYSLAGSIIFTSCNLFMVELSKEGLYGYLFFCYGTLFASCAFFLHRMNMAYSKRGRYFKWSDLYILNSNTGRIKWGTVVGLLLYSLMYQGGNILTILAFQYSSLSGVNQGIIISIYSMVPIWSAAIAYYVYKEKLQWNHCIGMVMLSLCMALISLSNIYDKDTRVQQPPPNASELEILTYNPSFPVCLALVATFLLGINMNLVKYYDRKGFPADVFAYACYGFTNFIQALISFIVFYYYGFNFTFFIFGFCGSFLNTLGLVFVALAVSSGLSGPSSALVNL